MERERAPLITCGAKRQARLRKQIFFILPDCGNCAHAGMGNCCDMINSRNHIK